MVTQSDSLASSLRHGLSEKAEMTARMKVEFLASPVGHGWLSFDHGCSSCCEQTIRLTLPGVDRVWARI